MEKENVKYGAYVQILKEELITAMGCTEPIALAYAAARCRELLGKLPEKVIVKVSGSIIKNVKSVVVPNTGGMKGIKTAVAAGLVAGRPERKLACCRLRILRKYRVSMRAAVLRFGLRSTSFRQRWQTVRRSR